MFVVLCFCFLDTNKIGPQQAIYSGQCSLLWPSCDSCPVTSDITWSNINIRDIKIKSSLQSPGLILGNNTNPMSNIFLENIIVNDTKLCPWGKDEKFKCYGTENVMINGKECASQEIDLVTNETCLFTSFGYKFANDFSEAIVEVSIILSLVYISVSVFFH